MPNPHRLVNHLTLALFGKSPMTRLAATLLIFALFLAAGCADDQDFFSPDDREQDAREDSDTRDEQADANAPNQDADKAQDDADNSANEDAVDADATGQAPVEGVEVAHKREVRGVWIPTVFNISWPSRSGLAAETQKNELRALLDVAQNAGLNTVYFQVRAEADAFYASDIEPWSRFLSGTMGQNPGWDPLEFVVEEAHKRGLELHAWLNPYRALASGNAALASANHITRARPDLVHYYDNLYWIDPGLFDGQAQTVTVIHDILARYDIDGIHFDDYFYPYPNGPFPDDATYSAYLAAGGDLSLGDFRRNNVHELVETVHELIKQERPDVRYGISPFGIYRPGIPDGIVGLDQYAAIYADPLRWLDEGWVDYIAPQLYWPTTQTPQAYEVLLHWWADQARSAGKDLYVGNYTSQLGSSSAWTVAELLEQIRLTRHARERGALGNIHYQINPIKENRAGITSALVNGFYAKPAAAPPIAGATGRPPMPELSVSAAGVQYEGAEKIRYFAVYLDHQLIKLVPGVQRQFGLARGDYLISAIDRLDRESLGVPITIEVDSAAPDEDPELPDGACSGSYQCCDGTWLNGQNSCGTCTCVETTGEQGCSP